MVVDEESDKKSDIQPHWMAAHVGLKNSLRRTKCTIIYEMAQLSSWQPSEKYNFYELQLVLGLKKNFHNKLSLECYFTN